MNKFPIQAGGAIGYTTISSCKFHHVIPSYATHIPYY